MLARQIKKIYILLHSEINKLDNFEQFKLKKVIKMEKDVKKYSLYLIAIVGIVAIVGIWTMVSGTGKLLTTGTSGESALLTDESGEGDLAGEAIKISKVSIGITCLPLPTGKKKCEQDNSGNQLFKEELKKSDCTKMWNVTPCSFLTNGDGRCNNYYGCCKYQQIYQGCKDTFVHTQIKYTCTGKITNEYEDCSETTDTLIGKPYVCVVSGTDFSHCQLNCNVGDAVYYCKENEYFKEYTYKQYVCSIYGNVKAWKQYGDYEVGWSDTCPTGATCYNPEGKCAGPKTT